MKIRLRPTHTLKHINEIDLETLKNQGIKALLFDLDNTLMIPKTAEYQQEVLDWLEIVRKDFKIAVLSNNTKSKYIQKVRLVSDFPIYDCAKKPDVKIALKALDELGVKTEEAVMIGDRPLTDILVGIRLNMITILVDPLNKLNESRFVRFLRWLERLSVKGGAPITYDV